MNEEPDIYLISGFLEKVKVYDFAIFKIEHKNVHINR